MQYLISSIFSAPTMAATDSITASNMVTAVMVDPAKATYVYSALIVMLTVIALRKLILKRKAVDMTSVKIPGIPGPEFGDELHQLVAATRHHGMIKMHEKYGELFQMPTRSGPIVFIRGADDLENVFSGKNLGKNASTWGVIDGAVDVSNLVQPMLVDTFFEWEGQRWQAARKDINPFFAHSEVGHITLETVLETMEHWSDSHETDFLNEAHNIVKMAVIRLLGGMKMDREATTVLDEVMTYFLGRNTSGEIPVFNKEDSYMIKKITPFCKRVIEWNRAENNEDNSAANKRSGLIANMIKSGKYTDQMIVNIFINLIVAGGETPALVCCKTLAGMIANPHVMEKAVQELNEVIGEGDLEEKHLADLTYLDYCLSEGLRRYAPATVVGRSVKADTELCGLIVPAGTSLHVNIHAVQMDPKVWPNPTQFDPSRWENEDEHHPYGLIAFGAGTRVCPGKRIYKKLAKTMIGAILKRYSASAKYTGNENDGVDLDTFLPNRFVAWDTKGIHVTFTKRDG